MARSGAFLLAAWLVSPVAAAEKSTTSACADAVLGARVIAVCGARLAPLADVPTSELRVLKFSGGRPIPIPFQVDECDAAGELVLDANGRGAGDSTLGARSVLLFRIEDAGDRDPRAAARGAVEIRISGGAGTPQRSVYVERASAKARRSTRDDVDYDPSSDMIRAERYTIGFQGPLVVHFAVADGKGRDREDLVDRFKARVDAHFLWGLFGFRRNEDDVTEEVLGYKDGPIRVVRRSRIGIEIGWGLPAPSIINEDYFYADHAEAPVHISLPFSLAYVFGDLDVRLYLDFLKLDGFRVVAEGLPSGARIVGSPPTDSAPENEPRTHWFLLEGRSVRFFHRLRFGPTLDRLDCRLFYVDDPARPDPPESTPGSVPAIGYRLTDWSSVRRGRHEIWMDTYIVDGPATADQVLARLAAPIAVDVRLTDGAGASHRRRKSDN